jgi:hypothetical protein
MSASAKRRVALERKAAKRAQKETRKALYASWRDQGKNVKSKRFLAKGKNGSVANVSHPNGACGNVGCRKCFPAIAARSDMYTGKAYYRRDAHGDLLNPWLAWDGTLGKHRDPEIAPHYQQ